jgi:ketose-bisphosphate aldolase
MKLNEILKETVQYQYAIGSFSPRYIHMIKPVLLAAQECKSPAIVQISEKEFDLYKITPYEFSEEYFRLVKNLGITVPTTLHLDHTRKVEIIKDAIAAGFESVMIDASAKEFEENVALSALVSEYAHSRGVSVEAELGRIGTTDSIETDDDSVHFTDPDEARIFVKRTNIDALAVSVGTQHGPYTVKKPYINFDLIKKIRDKTSVFLVLHGGSGVPDNMVINSYRLPGGGISKVNIATDLEQSFLRSINHNQRMDNQWCNLLPAEALETGMNAVKKTVMDKMCNYLNSAGRA